MNPLKNKPSYSWISRFAIEHIFSSIDLCRGDDFPHELWGKMGEAGFFKIGIAPAYGGSGGGYKQLLEAGEVFVRSSYSMGLALSWLYQQLIAVYLISGFGTERQRKKYLPRMAEGRLIASFAVSEPKHGGRPKYMTTTAVKDGKGFKLNGEKTYLTNAPVAGLFVVIAVTGEAKGQKQFSAFLVDHPIRGLTIQPQIKLDFLRPSPHGGILLRDCAVPAAAILGEQDRAFPDIVMPFSDAENIVLMGAVSGAMGAELMDVILEINQSRIGENKAVQSEIGALDALLETLRVVAREAAHKMDERDNYAIPLTLIFNELAESFQHRIAGVVGKWNLPMRERFKMLQADLNILGILGKKNIASKITKLGDELLHGKR
jgi:acyl-CoA dehydrogenase